MSHGIDHYHQERRLFERRVSLFMGSTALAVSLLALLVVVVRTAPWFERWRTDTARWGFEGPNQYVRRIVLEQMEGGATPIDLIGPVTIRVRSEKGGGEAVVKRDIAGEPVIEHRTTLGEGESDTSLIVHRVRRRADLPLIQSEELVIVRLVKPIYPAEAVEGNIEGRVQIQALVDTTGRVVEVQVFASTGAEILERAAQSAVWESRFRPYRVRGRAREVYALFRFNFHLD
jgi:TonB family protein